MKLLAPLLAASLALCASSAMAQTAETVTTTTTTVDGVPTSTTIERTVPATTTIQTAPVTTTVQAVPATTTTTITASPLALPAGVTYTVIDPTKSVIVGRYAVGQTLVPGTYVIEERTGKVVGTVDTTGRLIALSAMPTVIPRNMLIVNGTLVYFSSEFAYRRAKLELEVASDYSAGRLTHNQSKNLRQKLDEITLLENKRRSDGSFSKSTVRSIERKFADVQSDLARYVASTNSKKARIGIRVD